jgi:hypothetical protein
MPDLIPIRTCWHCSQPARRREFIFRDVKVCDFSACDECAAEVERELSAARPIFDAMIAAGVDRETANDTMTYLLNRWKP